MSCNYWVLYISCKFGVYNNTLVEKQGERKGKSPPVDSIKAELLSSSKYDLWKNMI